MILQRPLTALLFTIAFLGSCLLGTRGVEAQAVAASATLGQAVSLTSTAQSYTYVVGPPLFVVSAAGVSAGATATVDTITSVTTSLPDGFATQTGLLPGSISAAIGFSVVTSVDVGTSFQMALTTPPLTIAGGATLSGLISSGGLAVIYFDVAASVYAKIPATQITVDGQNRLVINYNRPGYFYLLKFDTTPVNKAIDSGVATFKLAANSSQSVAVSYQQRTVLTITNILAAGATLSVSLSAQAQAESTTAVLAGRQLASQIYTISYNGAAGTLQQATLVYNTSLAASTNAAVDVSSLVWCKFDTAANVWVAQNPTTLDANGQLSFTTKGFSDWSVQAQVTHTSAATTHTFHLSQLASMLGLTLAAFAAYHW